MIGSNSITPLMDSDAFCAGADLWVIQSNQNRWWQELDFKSGFLLSSSLLFQTNKNMSKVASIVDMTELTPLDFSVTTDTLLLGTADHFFNKWILVIQSSELESSLVEIAHVCQKLNANGLRFFSFSKNDILETTTRLSTSLPEISFVE